ncbi:MAG: methionine--tRNA ligase [Patescibacteria group bacterium]
MKPKFITTSIVYINAEPHIGFLFELLAGDILARYYRQLGQEVFFLTGTDEHGQKVAQAAQAAALSPIQFADQISASVLALKEKFNLSFDYFIRTTDPIHQQFVSECWSELVKSGQIARGRYQGFYCTGCEAFKLSGEIVNECCPIHNRPLEQVEEENYFFTPDKNSASKIEAWINRAVWPIGRRQDAINVLRSGTYDRISVSRPSSKNSWGVQVPGDPSQTIYVWFDALLNYLSVEKITGRKLHPADIQIIGKDILKFHAIIWPALLIALGRQLPEKLLVHGFIQVDGQKLSKSTGHTVAPQELLDRYAVAGDYAADAVRYLLFRQLSFDEDSNFVWSEFDAIYNGELANGLGNLVNRTVTLLKRYGKKSVGGAILTAIEDEDIKPNLALANADFSGDLESANFEVGQANEWLTRQKPWEWEAPTPLQLATFIDQRKLIQISYYLEPFMPVTAKEIRRQLITLEARPLFPRLPASL